MTARENLLQTLRCGTPQWVPVCPYLFPNENPTQGIPEELKGLFGLSSRDLAGDHLRLGAYLGAQDYMLPVSAPAVLVSDTCSTKHGPEGGNRRVTTLSTPRGDLRQVTVFPDGAPSLVTERYVKTADDAIKLMAYFSSLRLEVSQTAKKDIQDIQKRMGDRGVLFCRTMGTPLGMCYRLYFHLTHLVYLMVDEPVLMGDLFACMEEKFFLLYEGLLREASEIDAFLGMDDTSTTLISPAMFEEHNVGLTNKRADLCHAYGKLYLHHSCGLIRHLLPIYRKTRMDGIDAFTVPPVGDVGYAEGREILGPGYAIQAGLCGGLASLEEEDIRRHVAARFDDARRAGHVAFYVGGAHLTYPAMEMIFSQAQMLKRSSDG